MVVDTRKPLIVQGDSTVLLDVHDAGYESARAEIAPFSELEKSPEHMHTYRITPLSLWNAASTGLTAEAVIETLETFSRYPIPENVSFYIRDAIARYGKVKLTAFDGNDSTLLLTVEDDSLRAELEANRKLSKYLLPHVDGFVVRLFDRGTIKQELIRIGYPVQDEAPLADGERLEFGFRDLSLSGVSFSVRDYQREAASAFLGNSRPGTGFGTVVLPCGAGKTIVGMTVMELLKTNVLILTTNVAAVHQWRDELLDKTSLSPEAIGEYTGDNKSIRPITVGTYQILVWRSKKDGEYPHFRLFRERNWGLIIYDEVHLLPAPIFRATAELQAVRRLGLTATLVREDGREDDVFSLVGPKRYDVPWKELEAKGWIAEANCYEIRVDLPEELKIPYAVAESGRSSGLRAKTRSSSISPARSSKTIPRMQSW